MAEAEKKFGSSSDWLVQLKCAEKEDRTWIDRGRKIVKRYRDDRKATGMANEKKYNILWSNVRTMFPAIYARKPQAEVERRFKDQAPEARCASEMLERVLQYEIEHYGDFDSAIRNSLLDRLLPGRGVAWVRFEEQVPNEQQVQTTDDASQQVEPKKYECTAVDYVYWEDFRMSPARTWEEVTWVGRRVYMGTDEGVERFGDVFKTVPLSNVPVGLEDMQAENQMASATVEKMKKAKVWEIWNKTTLEAIWVAEGFSEILDIREDPIQVEGFFPCPKPLFSTMTTDTLVPVPDYCEYQDQAQEMDELTQRISRLVKAVKMVGVYDASQEGVQRMMQEGVDNQLVPIQNWASLVEKGGIKGAIDWLPMDQVITTLNELYVAREKVKQVIYEITGLSDILRGSSVASETATAQQIKSNYASLRLKETIGDVARFASDILRLKAEMICNFYSPQALIAISGIMGTDDAPLAQAAVQLLKNEPLRNYQIAVAADSMVELDEQAEKQARVEFLTSAGGFLKQAVEAAQAVPELAPLMGEMLMFGVRGFKAGRPIEAAFEKTVKALSQPKPQQPNPEMLKMQQDAQIEQQRIQADQQAEMAKAQADIAIERAKMQMQQQFDREAMQANMAARERELQIEAAANQQKLMLEMQLENMRLQLEQFKAIKQAETSITVAEINSQAVLSDQQEEAADKAAEDTD